MAASPGSAPISSTHSSGRWPDRRALRADQTRAQASRGAFFGRRKGRPLRTQQAALFDTLLPRLALDLSVPPPGDLGALFPAPIDAVHLEIGFGGAEHFIAQASAHPQRGFIGCEAFVNGMAKSLAAIARAQSGEVGTGSPQDCANNERIESLIRSDQIGSDSRGGLANVRLHFGDASALLDWLPTASIARVDLLYPDPWPKRRHWKRRFVQDESIAALARIIRPGGEFRFATDIPDYAAWTLMRMLRSPDFTWIAARAEDWRKPWAGFGGTRYEAKAIRAGRAPCYLTFRRT